MSCPHCQNPKPHTFGKMAKILGRSFEYGFARSGFKPRMTVATYQDPHNSAPALHIAAGAFGVGFWLARREAQA